MNSDPHTFHQALRQLATKRADATTGFFGPDSIVWQVNRERSNYLGGLRAILMQLAHPAVAQGVADHSNFQQDPLGRFVRTMSVVQDILFGPADVAVKAATRVYVKHMRVKGSLPATQGKEGEGERHYHALDPELLLWVYATLIDSLIFIHDEIFPPLGDKNWERLYQEGRPFAYLFGIPDAVLPPTLDDFRSYVNRMVNTLDVTDTAREMAQAVLRAPHPMFASSNTVLAAGSLPAPLRESFGLPWNLPVRTGYAAGISLLRVAVPLLPARLRTHTVNDENDPISKLKAHFLEKHTALQYRESSDP